MLERIENLLLQLKLMLEDLIARSLITGQQIVVTSLSEISERLGLIRAGEFRSGNTKEPGYGFTGLRIAYPPVSYAGDTWNLALVRSDVLEVGGNTDGKLYAAGGNLVIDSTGLNIDRLNYAIRQTATNEGNTRIGKITMTLLEGSAVLVFAMEYSSPVGSELMNNGDFEDGDFTGWTKTVEDRGAWSITENSVYAGSYSLRWTPTYGASLGILTSDRIEVDEAEPHIVSGALFNSTAVDDGYGIIHINWYDQVSGGTWLRTDVLGELNFTSTGWSLFEANYTPPAGALSAEVVIAIGDTTNV